MNQELSANTTLSHYRILSKLGEGGMGEVYRAHDERLDREVAIKLLPADFANDEDRLRRFEQEAKATSALNHMMSRGLRTEEEMKPGWGMRVGRRLCGFVGSGPGTVVQFELKGTP